MEKREHYQECVSCSGHGWVIARYQHPKRITPKEVICDVCAGTGQVEVEEDFSIEKSAERQSEMFGQIAQTVADTYNMIQEAIGSDIRITLNKK